MTQVDVKATWESMEVTVLLSLAKKNNQGDTDFCGWWNITEQQHHVEEVRSSCSSPFYDIHFAYKE